MNRLSYFHSFSLFYAIDASTFYSGRAADMQAGARVVVDTFRGEIEIDGKKYDIYSFLDMAVQIAALFDGAFPTETRRGS